MLVLLWCIASVAAGFLAGWVIGRYGYKERRVPREVLPVRHRDVLKKEIYRQNNKTLAAGLAAQNKMEIKR